MQHQSIRYVIYSQLILLASLTICLMLLHDTKLVHDGLSYFAVNGKTLPIAILAICAAAYFLFKSGRSLPKQPQELKILSRLLPALALLLLGLLLTPYTFSSWLYLMHLTFGGLLFALQFAYATWFWLIHKDVTVTFLVMLLVFAGLLAFGSLLNFFDAMLYGQVMFQFIFGILILRIMFSQESLRVGIVGYNSK